MTRSGLSLGDRACLSLSRARDLPVLTADHASLEIAAQLDVAIRSIR